MRDAPWHMTPSLTQIGFRKPTPWLVFGTEAPRVAIGFGFSELLIAIGFGFSQAPARLGFWRRKLPEPGDCSIPNLVFGVDTPAAIARSCFSILSSLGLYRTCGFVGSGAVWLPL